MPDFKINFTLNGERLKRITTLDSLREKKKNWASLVVQMIRNHLQCRRPGFDSWVGKNPWRRAWQLTPVFLAEEFHGQRSLEGYPPWACKESDTIESLTLKVKLKI